MENRHHSRVSLEPHCQARIRLGGQTYTDITVADLGPGGCRIQVPLHSANGLGDKAILDELELMHPALPTGTVKAKVVWVNVQDTALTELMESGVQFLEAPADYTRKLTNFVTFLAPPSTCLPE